MTRRRIIIDTDPGTDDAVAILLALAAPDAFDLLGVVAVAGNVGLASTARNARALLALGGRADIPVYAGCAGPLLRPAVTAEHVHGETGLQGLVLPPPAAPLAAEHGVDYLIRALREHAAGSVTLCLLGPATNLAVALIKAPEIAGRIGEIVWMAGAAREGGNVTPAAEFNVYADPDAARIVLGAGAPVTLVPLDLTHQLRLDGARKAALAGRDSVAARAVLALFAEQADAPLHDPCVIAHVLRPGLFTGMRCNVAVETGGALTMGMTVVDRHGVSGRAANATWLEEADREAFFALLLERLG